MSALLRLSSSSPRVSRVWIAILLAWCGCIAYGAHTLLRYSATPGELHAGLSWPAETKLALSNSPYTLLLFLHPHCPCSAATAGELERLLAQAPAGSLAVMAVFTRPAGVDDGWMATPLRARIARLPQVTVIEDDQSSEAIRFGATTSGTAMLFDRDGQLHLAGGITSGRGHEGDNPGRAAIVALARGRAAATARTHPFGCPLQASSCCDAEVHK